MKEAGEFELIARLCKGLTARRRTLLGPGDDCAVLAPTGHPQLFTIDSMVEGVHFKLEWTPARALGERSLTVNLSDIAAMGGVPHSCVVNLGIRPGLPSGLLEEIYAGLRRAARAAGVDIVGGNVTRSSELTITIALTGDAGPALLRRDRARVGDDIYVTGTLGDAALGLSLLAGERNATPAARRFLIGRYLAPSARLAAGAALARIDPAPAAIDISDGLLQDLGHILERSRKGAVVEAAALPLSRAYRAVAGDRIEPALSGGEDYELLFCLPAGASEQGLSRRLKVPVRRIGRILSRREGLGVIDAHGRALKALARGGWDQLRDARAPGT